MDGFKYKIDYPIDIAGYEDYNLEGTIPGGYLLAALAGCKGVLARLYLLARGMEDVSLDIKVTGDFGEDANKHCIVDLKTELIFDGDITEAEVKKIEKIIDQQCAIEHIILSDENTVETKYTIK